MPKKRNLLPPLGLKILQSTNTNNLVLPSIRMDGFSTFLIENHKGIGVYSDHTVSIFTCLGVVQIEGAHLTLHFAARDDIAVSGEIASILFKR